MARGLIGAGRDGMQVVRTAFAVRTDHASLRSVGVFSNKFLLAGIAVALAFAAAVVYLPVMHGLFGTAALSPAQLAIVARRQPRNGPGRSPGLPVLTSAAHRSSRTRLAVAAT